jgi:hypothetical protein
VTIANTLDPELYGLLEDCNEFLNDQCAEVGRFEANPGDDDARWRWTLIIGALLHDVSTTASSLAFHDYRRALLIMRRLVFEYCIRHRFYLQHPDVASRSLNDYFREADRFFTRLNDPQSDKAFIDGVRQEAIKRGKRPEDKWDNFYNVVADQNSRKADEWYAAFYTFPSALIHASPLCSLDLFERREDGSIRLHMESRHANVNQILYNVIWFVIGFLRACDQTYSLGRYDNVATFELRLYSIADRLEVDRETA